MASAVQFCGCRVSIGNLIRSWLRRRRGLPEPVGIEAWFEEGVPESLAQAHATACGMIGDVHLVSDPELLERWIGGLPGEGRAEPISVPLNRNCVPVREIWMPRIYGRYTKSRREPEETELGPLMEIRPDRDHLVTTIVHETFHLIHREMLHPKRALRREDSQARFDGVLAAIGRSNAHAYSDRAYLDAQVTLERLVSEPDVPPGVLARNQEVAEIFRYIVSDTEWLARSYTQVVFRRHNRRLPKGARPLSLGIDPLESEIRVNLPDRDLRAVEREFDRLFQALGWR